MQVLLPPHWNQLSPAARAGSSLPPPLTQASEQQKSIFRLGVLFGEIHIAPSVFVLISSAVYQNDGSRAPLPIYPNALRQVLCQLLAESSTRSRGCVSHRRTGACTDPPILSYRPDIGCGLHETAKRRHVRDQHFGCNRGCNGVGSCVPADVRRRPAEPLETPISGIFVRRRICENVPVFGWQCGGVRPRTVADVYGPLEYLFTHPGNVGVTARRTLLALCAKRPTVGSLASGVVSARDATRGLDEYQHHFLI